MPSAVHYVGYVEDDETPEMIMAKFAELERIRQAVGITANEPPPEALAMESEAQYEPAAHAADQPPAPATAAAAGQPLTDEQLLQVFKQTSMFNLKTALHDNAMLMNIDDGDDDPLSDHDGDFFRSFWSDDEDALAMGSEEYSEDELGTKRIVGPARPGASRRGHSSVRVPRNAAAAKARHNVVTAYNPETQALVRRRVRAADPHEIVQIRIPPAPIPVSWGRTVRPYVPPSNNVPVSDGDRNSTYVELPSLRKLTVKALPSIEYQAALINLGWLCDGEGHEAMAALSSLPLPSLVPSGFVFVWTPKDKIHAVCKLMGSWGYVYIENLTWCYLAANNSILTLPSRFVCSSHLTLYMFRMVDKGRNIELRHQRNPDVTFDCLAAVPDSPGVAVPEGTFAAIETLLPTGAGKLLELWAPKGLRRPGWTHVVEVGSAGP